MEQAATILHMLEQIERTSGELRKKAIGDLQEEIWAEKIKHTTLNEFLFEFASDLNFYEPYGPDRTEELGYYDDTKLDELIQHARSEIEKKLSV